MESLFMNKKNSKTLPMKKATQRSFCLIPEPSDIWSILRYKDTYLDGHYVTEEENLITMAPDGEELTPMGPEEIDDFKNEWDEKWQDGEIVDDIYKFVNDEWQWQPPMEVEDFLIFLKYLFGDEVEYL